MPPNPIEGDHTGHLRRGEPMTQGDRRCRWHRIVVAGAVAALAWSAAYAKDSTTYVKEAEQYIAQGDLKAAEIQLRNAIREAPQDPVLRARLADVYLQLGDAYRPNARRGPPASAMAIRPIICRS